MSSHPKPGLKWGDRLRLALGRLRDHAGGSFPLQKLIWQHTRVAIHRHRINRLLDPAANALLNLEELEALEEVAHAEGLGTIFMQPSLLREIAQVRRVLMPIGTHVQVREHQSFCALFDVRAAMVLARGLERAANLPIAWELEQVPASAGHRDRKWAPPESAAVVSLGSSALNATSERILARALSRRAFDPAQAYPFQDDAVSPISFAFVWEHPVNSTFAVSVEQLRRLAPATVRKQLLDQKKLVHQFLPKGSEVRGILVRRENQEPRYYPEIERLADRSVVRSAWGVIVSERQPGLPPLVVCAGLNGPSTFLAAQMLADGSVGAQLSSVAVDEAHIHFALVRGRITETSEPGDDREVSSGLVPEELVARRRDRVLTLIEARPPGQPGRAAATGSGTPPQPQR